MINCPAGCDLFEHQHAEDLVASCDHASNLDDLRFLLEEVLGWGSAATIQSCNFFLMYHVIVSQFAVSQFSVYVWPRTHLPCGPWSSSLLHLLTMLLLPSAINHYSVLDTVVLYYYYSCVHHLLTVWPGSVIKHFHPHQFHLLLSSVPAATLSIFSVCLMLAASLDLLSYLTF